MCILNKRETWSHTKKGKFYSELSGHFEGSFSHVSFGALSRFKNMPVDMNGGQ